MEDKDIDRLFQERLKDMEITPDPKVWKAIEEKLQKKKRRVFPFWWFSSGAVASIIIMFFLFNTKTENKSNFPVITNKSDVLPEPINFKIDTLKEVLTINVKEENISIENKKNLPTQKNNSITKVGEKAIIINDNSAKKETNINEYQYITHKKNNSDKKVSIKSYQKTNQGLNNNSLLTDNSFEEENNVNKSINNSAYNTEVNQSLSLSNNYTENNKDNITSILNNDDIKEKNTTKNDTIKKKDFIAEMNKKEDKESVETKNWKVNPVLGVLNSSSFSNDDSENNLNFNGNNSLAYGVNVEYTLNKKWTLKSGIQLQKSSYSSERINNISNVQVLSSYTNIDVIKLYTTNNTSSDQQQELITSDPTIIDNGTQVINEDIKPILINSEDTIDSNEKSEYLKQQYSYIEIPIETKFTFYSKPKTQISLVSGFSTLVLNENKIITVVDNTEETIGKLTNLNSLNFSGNLGIDIDFLIFDKIHFNVNPMFKSQLNTFTTTNFKPYIIGLYSGLKYQF